MEKARNYREATWMKLNTRREEQNTPNFQKTQAQLPYNVGAEWETWSPRAVPRTTPCINYLKFSH